MITDTQANAVLDKLLGQAVGSGGLWPATVYIGLLLAEPNADGSGVVEPAGGLGYARVGVTNNATQWPAASTRQKTHANSITFAAASGGNWGTVTYVGIFDAVSGGNLLAAGALQTSRPVNDGDVFRFLPVTAPLLVSLPA